MSHRTEQTESAITRAVSKVLSAGLADPRYKGMATVTQVRLEEDRRSAWVGISVMPDSAAKPTISAIQHAAAYIRREVGEQIRTRRMPVLRFELDHSLKREADLLGAIHQAMAEEDTDAASPPTDAAPPSDPTKGDS